MEPKRQQQRWWNIQHKTTISSSTKLWHSKTNGRKKKSFYTLFVISIKIKCFENIFGVRAAKKFTVMTELVRWWCDFYCFVLWFHLRPCHVSIQFVFVCKFGRKRFPIAVECVPDCIVIIIICERVFVLELEWEHIPLHFFYCWAVARTFCWITFDWTLRSSVHSAHSHIRYL